MTERSATRYQDGSLGWEVHEVEASEASGLEFAAAVMSAAPCAAELAGVD